MEFIDDPRFTKDMRFTERYLQVDLARSMLFNRAEMLDLLGLMATVGYNGLTVYLEGSFAFNALPGEVRHGVMTPEDARWLVDEARHRGICVVPMTGLLSHMEQFIDQERFWHLSDDGKAQPDFANEACEAFVLTIAHELAEHFQTNIVHIGADEAELDETSRPRYADFLRRLCGKLLSEGLTPAIWSDMLWMHPELVGDLPRDVIIYDWNYFGHRPASLSFWRELGFERVFACPSDLAWTGFINYQRSGTQLKAQPEPAVKMDEVEAFLQDAVDQGVTSGCLTWWENQFGNPCWAQMVPFARAGLFMSGRWTPGAPGAPKDIRDEALESLIEQSLFGRLTPYSRITRILQEGVMAPVLAYRSILRADALRHAVFLAEPLARVLAAAPRLGAELPSAWAVAVADAKTAMATWAPATEREARCKLAMELVCATVTAAGAIVHAGQQASSLYHEAALCQYCGGGPDGGPGEAEFESLLERAAEAFAPIGQAYAELVPAIGRMATASGHSPGDIGLAEGSLAAMGDLQASLREYARAATASAASSMVPLPAWPRLVDKVVLGKVIWGAL